MMTGARSTVLLQLTRSERQCLKLLLTDKDTHPLVSRKCRILLLAEELSTRKIAQYVRCSRPTVIATIRSFRTDGLQALFKRRTAVPRSLTPQLEQAILKTVATPFPGSWTTRTLATHVRCSRMMVNRVLQKHGIRLPRVRPSKSKSRQMEQRIQDVVALYVDISMAAIVLTVRHRTTVHEASRHPPTLAATIAMLSREMTGVDISKDAAVLRLFHHIGHTAKQLYIVLQCDPNREQTVRGALLSTRRCKVKVLRTRGAWLTTIEHVLGTYFAPPTPDNSLALQNALYRRLASENRNRLFLWVQPTG
jgi:transposase